MTEPNPPQWPKSVVLIRPTDDPQSIRERLEATQDSYHADHGTFTSDHHFSPRRLAVLFAPGTYNQVRFQVGYYVQVTGLGRSPDQVRFVGKDSGPFVPALNRHLHEHGTCLDTFWRSGENFYTQGNMQWAVSQASPLRRVHVGGDLYLHEGAAYASGGHLANAQVDGRIYAGGQQQFLFKNVHMADGASGGAWSMVYVGCTGIVPAPSAGGSEEAAVTVVEKPRIRIEKPYIAMKDDGIEYELRIPMPLYDGPIQGPLMDESLEQVVDFAQVRVVCDTEPTARIQEALDQGKHVVLAPGTYELDQSLEMRHPDQVLLGLGLATLVSPTSGDPCIKVAPAVPGVRIAGVMLEASETRAKSLLEWGHEGSNDAGTKENPGAMFDVFCRVGGATSGDREAIAVDTMMKLHSGHVIGDNLWLWRADHAELGSDTANYPEISPIFWQSEQHQYRVETGIEVNGDDITMYGLAVEHANGHQTVWSGERGVVHFYQCEFPYGVDRAFQEKQFRGYLVKDHVHEHAVHAPGIYSNFRNEAVFVETAMEYPENASVTCVNPFTVKLDNHGGISTIANGRGDAALTRGIPVRFK